MKMYNSAVNGPDGFARPTGIQIYIGSRRCAFFMGDRWHDIGPIETENKGFTLVFPDFDAYFAERELLDDGTKEWREWGPRVN